MYNKAKIHISDPIKNYLKNRLFFVSLAIGEYQKIKNVDHSVMNWSGDLERESSKSKIRMYQEWLEELKKSINNNWVSVNEISDMNKFYMKICNKLEDYEEQEDNSKFYSTCQRGRRY